MVKNTGQHWATLGNAPKIIQNSKQVHTSRSLLRSITGAPCWRTVTTIRMNHPPTCKKKSLLTNVIKLTIGITIINIYH